jgi:hypothetical protein
MLEEQIENLRCLREQTLFPLNKTKYLESSQGSTSARAHRRVATHGRTVHAQSLS